jgi:hypothetical protein
MRALSVLSQPELGDTTELNAGLLFCCPFLGNNTEYAYRAAYVPSMLPIVQLRSNNTGTLQTRDLQLSFALHVCLVRCFQSQMRLLWKSMKLYIRLVLKRMNYS